MILYLEESTNTIHLIEDWETLEDQAAYLNWRIDRPINIFDPILEGGASSIKIKICGTKRKYLISISKNDE